MKHMSRAKPKTRLLNHAMKVIKSFNGEPFTAVEVYERWDAHASVRLKPTSRDVVGLMRNLHSQGKIKQIEHHGDNQIRTNGSSGGTYAINLWCEVELDGKNSD